MRILVRRAKLLFVLALVIGPASLFAQDNGVTIAGSGIVAPLVEAYAEASDTTDAITLDITGTDNGFAAFCDNIVGATGATRAITTEEEALCLQNEIVFNEYLIGHNIIAAITHPDLEFAVCLDLTALEEMLAPSASGVVNDWIDLDIIDVETPESTPLSVYLPAANTATYAIVDRFVDGFGLRSDALTSDNDAATLDAVASTPGAIGFVNLASIGSREDVNILQISRDLQTGCQTASAEAVESRTYPLGDRLFLYINETAEASGAIDALIAAFSNPENAALVSDQGYTAPTDSAYSINQELVSGEEAGRQFSLEAISFEISANLSGNVAIGGGAHLTSYLTSLTTQFSTLYPGTTFDVQTYGTPGGERQLCNGEIDLLSAYGPLADDVVQNCVANNIDTVTFDLGGQGAVLVANAETSYLECLTREQVMTVWAAPAADAEAVSLWSQVITDAPDDEIFLFTPVRGSILTDLLLTQPEGAVGILRENITETGRNAAYRAAAVTNAPGALTYMSWQEYRAVLENGQEGTRLVQIDAGDGCIAPDETTIADGTYPLSERGLLIANQTSLIRPEVQSILWFLFSDENFTAYENTNFVGLSAEQLPEIRADLQTTFAEAQAALLEVGPEETPEPGIEATAEPGTEATSEATSEAGE